MKNAETFCTTQARVQPSIPALTEEDRVYRDDLWDVLDHCSVKEIDDLVARLHAGKMTGKTALLQNGCTCIRGSIAASRGCNPWNSPLMHADGWLSVFIHGNSGRHTIERFVFRVLPGDTPANSPTVAKLVHWITQYQSKHEPRAVEVK